MDDPLEANKRIVREYHELAINQRKPEEAVAKYLGPHYRQHNPGAADGPEPFIGFVKRFAQTYPDFRMESKRIIAEGNIAAIGGADRVKVAAVVDVFTQVPAQHKIAGGVGVGIFFQDIFIRRVVQERAFWGDLNVQGALYIDDRSSRDESSSKNAITDLGVDGPEFNTGMHHRSFLQ